MKLQNVDNAATPEHMESWKARHSVEFDINSSKLALKGGARVNSVLGVFDLYKSYLDLKMSQYEYAPYYMQDEKGVFTIGYSKKGLFSKPIILKPISQVRLEGRKSKLTRKNSTSGSRREKHYGGI